MLAALLAAKCEVLSSADRVYEAWMLDRSDVELINTWWDVVRDVCCASVQRTAIDLECKS